MKGGKVRLLATFTTQRLISHPDVPTVKELGYDLVIESPIGLVTPKNLDPKIAARLGAAFRKATTDPAYLKQPDPVWSESPARLHAVRRERSLSVATWRGVLASMYQR